MNSEKYDAVIIGTGQAAVPLARKLASENLSTAVIERAHPGGSCINYGCTPTKTMLASAKLAWETAHSEEWGVFCENSRVNMDKIIQRRDAIIMSGRKSVEQALSNNDRIDLIFGVAKFSGPKKVTVVTNDGHEYEISADRFFINTGSTANIPPIEGIEKINFYHQKNIMDITTIPLNLIIVGGGNIGVEFGQMFSRFGSNVTIIEAGDQLLPKEDRDAAEEMQSILEREGIAVHLSTMPKKVVQENRHSINLTAENGGKEVDISGSHLLIATGTSPATFELNTAAAGIETNKSGYIKVNDKCETSSSGIFALGDCKEGAEFTHIAYDDYRIVADHLFGKNERSLSNRILSYTVFTDPQLATVGMNEKSANEKGIDYKVAKIPMSEVARGYETNHTDGFMKALINPKDDTILGCTFIGEVAGETMAIIQIAMLAGMKYTGLRDRPFAHPTYAEGLNNLFMAV
ncbi:MAG: mercuric reductase [Candidatus Kapaibacterium sp.]